MPGDGSVLCKGMVTLDDEGTILSVTDNQGTFRESEGVEFYNGVLIPGLVNCHLHLELSHLAGKTPQGADLAAFIEAVGSFRQMFCPPEVMLAADRALFEGGTVACADISNLALSAPVKAQSAIAYHTFVELFGTDPSAAPSILERGKSLSREFSLYNLPVSLTPHAPYSVSPRLWEAIHEEHSASISMYRQGISIHLAESDLENEMFVRGTGALTRYVQSRPGAFFDKAPGLRSVQAVLSRLSSFGQVLAVHNTFLDEADLEAISDGDTPFFFVLCPRSNLYMGNPLPPVHLFMRKGATICLGTDSLASNGVLSLLEEMITLQRSFPAVSLSDLVTWATCNGAKALQLDHRLGRLRPGLQPGVMLLENLDLQHLQLTPETTLRRLAG